MPSLGTAVAVLHEGRVLLTRREDADMWCLPGGAVDDGESIARAAEREVREETGLIVRVTRLVGLYSRPAWNNHSVVFAAELVGGELRPDPAEVVAAGFFEPAALPEPLLWWYERPIREALAGVGGSAAWTLDVPWPFGQTRDRRALYEWRDRSGLSRVEFAQRYFNQRGPDGEVADVPGRPVERP
jgi:ADP-ribose pyrophosphatase YjhB (NUDIX family)